MVTADRMLACISCQQPLVGLPAKVLAKSIDTGLEFSSAADAPSHGAPIRAITFNPQTMRSTLKRSAFPMQFKSLRAHLVGMQEARLCDTETKKLPEGDFLQCSSACDSGGQGGCVLLINLSIDWGSPQVGDDVPVQCAPTEDEVSIVLALPRILIVQITAQCCSAEVIALHASETDAENWWLALVDTVEQYLRPGDPRIVLGDCNTQFGVPL